MIERRTNIGNAIKLDGVNQGIVTSPFPRPVATDSFTIEVICRLLSLPARSILVRTRQRPINTTIYSNGDLYFQLNTDLGWVSSRYNNTIAANERLHLFFRYDGSQSTEGQSVFKNKTELSNTNPISSFSTFGTLGLDGMSIGGFFRSGAYPNPNYESNSLDGEIYRTVYYDKHLTVAEINDLTDFKVSPGDVGNRVFHYEYNQNRGEFIQDLSCNGHTGVIVNANTDYGGGTFIDELQNTAK